MKWKRGYRKSSNLLTPVLSAIGDRRSNRMLGRNERGQLERFITDSLKQLVPDDHLLARVDRVLDLSWLREEVTD